MLKTLLRRGLLIGADEPGDLPSGPPEGRGRYRNGGLTMTKPMTTKATARQATIADVALALNPKLAGVLAVAFGAFLLFGAAFAQPAAVHDAAHDSRHSFAFPCH